MNAPEQVPAGFLDALTRLVALDTVSPLDPTRWRACATELARHGCRPVGAGLFGYGQPSAPVWLYGHVDTKPPGVMDEWGSDPFTLTRRAGRWVGLGVSDSKFQLLNALAVANPQRHFVLVDTCEEYDGDGAAAAYLTEHAPDTLVICDGARGAEVDTYAGYQGQADGTIHLATGHPVRHPARPGGDVSGLLGQLLAQGAMSVPRFTLTGLSAPATTRSLALQRASVRFDIRFGPSDEPAVRRFLEGWPHELRQWMYPVAGTQPAAVDGIAFGGLAPFSNRLGRHGPPPVRRVVVVPGADPDNRNHQPDEFIRPGQANRHRNTLQRVVRQLEENSDD